MRRRSLSIVLVLLLLGSAGATLAQGLTNATLRGRVTNEGQGLPGVTVTITSRSLQGARTAVTSTNGDYVLVGLPPGDYTVVFAIQAFRTVTQTLALSAAQESRVDAVMNLAGVEAAATVVARGETVSTALQASSTFTKELTDALPVQRNLLSSVQLAPGVNTNGPNSSDRIGNGVSAVVTISGAQSFDNLFTVDGAVVTDNIRGTPNNLFVEEALAETTTSTSSISAEFGRFTGGVVNAVTKSGGNTFSGSFRTTLTNAAWQAESPSNEVLPQKLSPQYEATLGGPIWKDHVWFFGSGRLFDQTTSGQTSITNLPFSIGDNEKRYQGKLTLTPVVNHSLTGNYLRVDEEQTNSSFGTILDLDSLVPSRTLPQDILTANYNGVLTSNLFVEGLYSRRKFTFEGSGSLYTDLIQGTLMRDISRGRARYNAPTFCGVCDPESRDNRDILVKGTYFLSSDKLGSHNIVVGYDNFSGQHKSNNYQSGSNYRLFTTSTIPQGGDIFPVLDSHSYVYYTPITNLSKGSDALTHSVFLNDSWRVSDRISVNLGVRWDKNDAQDSRGVVTADDAAFSPRLGATWDVTGRGKLKIAASYAKYVGAIQDNLVNSASDAGSSSLFIWYYDGPGATPINVNPAPGAQLTTRAQALQQVFNWFFAQGCPNLATCQLPLAYVNIPGLTTRFNETLKSPSTKEYTLGVAGMLGAATAYRVDVVRREGADFYNNYLNASTGRGDDGFGNVFDIGYINNTNSVERNYTGLHTSLAYRKGGFSGGLNWTWSHTLGNVNGEAANTGPAPVITETYPEYKDTSWSNPYGSLLTDQRHRVRLFASYTLPFVPERLGSVNVSGVHSVDTGVPYGAVGLVNSAPYVSNGPNYATPPTSVTYYYTARDAFRTNTIQRTDLALNFSAKIAGLVEIFVQPQVLNVLNNRGLRAVDTTVLTAVNAARFLPFNPFTETPVQGARPAPGGTATTNWDYGASFGQARNALDYQLPRTFTIAAGVRF
ncbi:MAG: TonB-dependent receptor [Thermoanaerobaculia bacterium]|nr:TonB-dependent receptor [Thermoanaerobaculia bacterium]